MKTKKTEETKETGKVKIRFFRVLKKNCLNPFSVELPFYVSINGDLFYRDYNKRKKFDISGGDLSQMESDVKDGYAVEIELSEAVFSMTKELAEVLDFFKTEMKSSI